MPHLTDVQLSSLQLVQMLGAAFAALMAGACDHGLRLACHALEAAWPPATDPACIAAKQQVLQRSLLPAFPDRAAAAAPASTATAVARTLSADLRQHCPDITLSALRCLALRLRTMLLERFSGPHADAASRLGSEQQVYSQFLIDCQVGMSMAEAAGSPAAALQTAFEAAALLLGMQHQPELQQAGIGAEALAEEALSRMVAAKSEWVLARAWVGCTSIWWHAVGSHTCSPWPLSLSLCCMRLYACMVAHGRQQRALPGFDLFQLRL